MTTDQIISLMEQGHDNAHIANFGQCSYEQIGRAMCKRSGLMRVAYLPANSCWAVMFGDSVLRLGFDDKRDAYIALGRGEC